MTPLRSLCVLLACWCARAEERPSYPDLPGPYCATRPGARLMQCCSSRDDPCSVSILGTLCYCDEFCDRGATGDCCPDYFRFCRNETVPTPPPPQPVRRPCKFKGRNYSYGDLFRDNCNVCTCAGDVASPEMRCEDDACLVDPVLVEVLNQQPQRTGWTASNYSHFWGMKLTEGQRHLLGTDYPETLLSAMYPVTRTPVWLPESFDARRRWPTLVGGVVDQGWCGASWAVSTTTVASDRFSIQRGYRTELSIQNVLDCAAQQRRRRRRTCGGGGLDRAWNYLRLNRVVEAVCYPYTGGESEGCLTSGDTFTLFCRNNRTFVTSSRSQLLGVQPSYRISGERDIMHEIYTHGPVQAIVRVQRDLFLYRSGVYHATSNRDRLAPYHSVRILGWGVERTPGAAASNGADATEGNGHDAAEGNGPNVTEDNGHDAAESNGGLTADDNEGSTAEENEWDAAEGSGGNAAEEDTGNAAEEDTGNAAEGNGGNAIEENTADEGIQQSIDERVTKYWLVANSWGRRWGEDGIVRIRRGTNEVDIEAFVVGAWGYVHPSNDHARHAGAA